MADEIESMRLADKIFADLIEDARPRVFAWIGAKYYLTSSQTNKSRTQGDVGSDNSGQTSFDGKLGDFADFYHKASPSDNAGRALVAGYWLSETTSGEAFQSQALNAMLKDLGFQVGNITDALSSCMRVKPAWIVQTRKAGSAKQARKTYKITDAGKRRVQQMIANVEQE